MAIKINFDLANNPEEPTFILAKRNGDKLGKIYASSIETKDALNDAEEITFNVNKYINGNKTNLWDDIVDFKLVYCVEWDMWFEIRVELDESVDTVKTVFATNLGCAELSQTMLYDIQINTEDDIARDEYTIPTVLYNPEHKDASLLHRITEKVPHYRISHVDDTIANIQRTFEFDDESIYDAFQEISEEINCLFLLNSSSNATNGIDRTISVYDLESSCNECGYRGEFTQTCPKCGSNDIYEGYGDDTRIFIAADELADEIQFNLDTESIKNCFKLEAGDDLMTATIRNCNPNGSDYIWYISDDMKNDMSSNLVKKLKSYDELYGYYTNDYVASLDESKINEYNSLVDKYIGYNENLAKIDVPIQGFASLMNAYYDSIDLELYLRSGLMPTSEMSDTSAEKEASKLTAENLSPVSTEDIGSLSLSTANNIVLAMAKVIVDSRYKVKVNNSKLDREIPTWVWTGNFSVTNYSNEEDTIISETISISIDNNYESFVEQKIEKMLAKDEVEDVSIVSLFKMDIDDFKLELTKYSLNRLSSFFDAAQSCIDILIEQGVADQKTWSGEDPNLYDDLYVPYLNKKTAISQEMSIRQSEVDLIAGVLDENGDIEEEGILTIIEGIKSDVQNELDFQSYLGDSLWLEFCSFRREDKYSNDNYISDGLNNAEIIKKAQEFIDVANKEIYKSSEMQHNISANLKNLLVVDKFKSLTNDFKVGNWLRIMVDDRVYKLRLIEYSVDYDDIDNISVEFSDITKVNSNLRSVQGIIKQASSMATSYSSVKRQAKQGEESNSVLNNWVNSGLNTTNTKIVSGSDGETQTWDNHGMLFRKYNSETETYDPGQMKIIHSTIAITDDDWETTKTAIGNYYYIDPATGEMKNAYGVNAETIVGNLVLGESLSFSNKSGRLSFDDENGLSATNKADTNRLIINPEDSASIFKAQKKNANNQYTNVLAFGNDGDLYLTGNITATSLTLADDVAIGSNNLSGLSDVAFSGRYEDLYDPPTYAAVASTGSYNDLKDKPMFATVATSGKYSDLSGRPTLSDVATSGRYTDLIGASDDAGKILYVSSDGSVTAIGIDELKVLLGI